MSPPPPSGPHPPTSPLPPTGPTGTPAAEPGVAPGGPRPPRPGGHRRSPGTVSAARRRAMRRRRRSVVAAATAVVIGLLAWTGAWFVGTVHEGPAGAPVVVAVPRRASAQSITSALAHRGVVASGLAFRAYLFLKGTPSIGPGDYLLRRHEAFGAVLDRLTTGPDVFPVTVQVGTTVAELGQQVGDDVPGWTPDRLVAAAATVRSPWQPAGSTNLDGLLGPGTYLVTPGETPGALLTAMVDRFDAEAAAAGLPAAAVADGVTPYQAVTIASVVEKEGYYPKNFGGVARVVYNRLDAGMPLQMDATVLYALGQDGGPVTPADEQVGSPYNTYLHTGLPPTPICFPSVAALHSALHPPTGDWLYFELVRKDGTMAFETTLAQHDADIALAHSRGLP